MKTTKQETEVSHSEQQARTQLDSIVEMVSALNRATENDDDDKIETARDLIQQDPLSVEVRTDWHSLDATDTKPTHYRILLCWGGPACQITGGLDQYMQPETAEIQHQDWGTPWTRLFPLSYEENAALLAYAKEFYFGE